MPTPVIQRVCPRCQGLAPTPSAACPHCGARFGNETAWNVWTIVFVFALCYALWFAVRLV